MTNFPGTKFWYLNIKEYKIFFSNGYPRASPFFSKDFKENIKI